MAKQNEPKQSDENTDKIEPEASIAEEEQSAEQPADGAASKHDLGDGGQVAKDEPPKPANKFKKFFAGYWHHKRWTLPLTLLVVIGILFAVPTTRYPILALKMKRQFDVVVWDSKTHTPVSGAKISLDGKTLTTNASGAAVFHAKVGKRTIGVSKQYYKELSEGVFVGVTHADTNVRTVMLVAIGRQVPIKVVNKISGKPVDNADIKILNTEAKTDANGTATIVLPTSSSARAATITASGFNDGAGNVQVTSKIVAANTFSLTPSGRVYFLSNLSGNIDVVSTNLDGTARKTVLPGTGSEDSSNTDLLASTDWKYLALLSKRDGGKDAKLFLINTGNNQATTIDDTPAAYEPVGWAGHYFVYEINPDNVQGWQNGQEQIKSYNADTGKTITLDQTSAQGTAGEYVWQTFGNYSGGTYIMSADNKIVYEKEWHGPDGTDPIYGPNVSLNGKADQILSVSPDGSGRQVIKSLTVAKGSYQSINSFAYNPQEIYFQQEVLAGNSISDVYYEYGNNTVTQSNTITDNSYTQTSQNYATYLLSPSGNQTFWAEPRDGKNTLFVGNAAGDNGKQIATLSSNTSYGWFTDNYLLVEQGGSELYIMPTSGGKALKVSDYYKPSQNFNGYGSGYGGL